jgi:NADH-quinone oxidoreductase subunit L
MTVPLWVLAILSVVALVLGLPGHGPWGELFAKFTDPVFEQAKELLHVEEHAALWPFAVAWLVAVSMAGLAWSMYAGGLVGVPARLATQFRGAYRFTYDKFRVDELYDVLVIGAVKKLAYFLWRVGDAFLIDGVVVNGVAKAAGFLARSFRFVQNGDVQRYAAIMAAAAAVILWTVLGMGGR